VVLVGWFVVAPEWINLPTMLLAAAGTLAPPPSLPHATWC